MGFRLVPKSVTLNDLERRNGRLVCVILLNSVGFMASSVQLVDYLLLCCLSPDKCHKVHQLSTTDALCSSR